MNCTETENHTLRCEEQTINSLDLKIPLKLSFLNRPCGIEYIGVLNMLTTCGKIKILKKSLSVYQEVQKDEERRRKEEQWVDTAAAHSSIIPLRLVAAVKRNH